MSKYIFQPGLMQTIKQADDGRGFFSNTQVQVNYDESTGKVWGDWCVGSEWHEYHDPSIIKVGKFAGKYTRRDIVKDIETMELIDEIRAINYPESYR